MSRIKKTLAVALMTGATLLSAAAPAAAEPAPRGPCNGLVDATCYYCGHTSGDGFGYPYSYCYGNRDYVFMGCLSWVSDRCYVGLVLLDG